MNAIEIRCTKQKILILIGLAAICAFGGCYRRVVRIEGEAPGVYKVYEPNLKDDDQPKSKYNDTAQNKTAPNRTVPNKTMP